MKAHLLLLPLTLLIASCGGGSPSASLDITSTSTSESSLSSEEEEAFISVNWDESDEVSSGMSLGGTFIDVAVNEALLTYVPFGFTYSFTDGASVSGATIKITDNGVAEVRNETDGSFFLYGLKEGEIVLKLYDSDGFLHYRNKITFRDGKTPEELLQWCYEEVDHYESNFFKGASITFVSPTSALYSGFDEDMPIAEPISFSLEYSYSSNTEHFFTVLDWNNTNGGVTLTVVTLAIDQTGYMAHPITRNGLVDFFTPVFA